MVKLRDTNVEPDKPVKEERLSSPDVARGVVLLLFVSGGFGLKQMLPNEQRWGWITNQWAHRAWEGCTTLSILAPALLFLVGVAMPYAYANRQAQGQGWFRQFLHAIIRACVLILIGIYLDSYAVNRLGFAMNGHLQVLGLAYLLAFLVMPLGKAVQGVSIAFLMIGITTAHVLYAFAGDHELWSQAQNIDTAFNQALRLAPRPGNQATLNFIPAAAVILGGILIGGLVKGKESKGVKVAIMTISSILLIILGWVLSGGGGVIDFTWFTVVPMIRQLMTWTYVMTSVGWTLLFFTYVYLPMDGLGIRFWAAPIALVGRNSLAVYVVYRLFHDWAEKSAGLLVPTNLPIVPALRPLVIALLVMLIFWVMCFWLNRRRIYVKV